MVSALMVGGAVAAGVVGFCLAGLGNHHDGRGGSMHLTKCNVTHNSGVLTASGGRSGCSNSATITVRLAEDVSFTPDPIHAQTSRTISNGTVYASSGCGATGRGNFYSWVISTTGNSAESGRTSHC